MNKKQSWEEEFDSKFLEMTYCGDIECAYEGSDKCFHGSENEIKDFIKKAIQNREREIEENVAGSVYALMYQEGEMPEFDNWRKNVLPSIINNK